MEARNIDEYNTANNPSEKILALSKIDYLQAQIFLEAYWKTEFYQRLEEQFNHRPEQMTADDYILFVLSRREGKPDYVKLTTSLEQTELNLNEETKNHLAIIQIIAKLNTEIDKNEKHILNVELGCALARRCLKIDPRFERMSSEEVNAKKNQQLWFETLPEEEKIERKRQIEERWEERKKRRQAIKEELTREQGEKDYAEFQRQEKARKMRRKEREEKEKRLPNPEKNPQLFPLYQLLEKERECLRIKDGAGVTYA